MEPIKITDEEKNNNFADEYIADVQTLEPGTKVALRERKEDISWWNHGETYRDKDTGKIMITTYDSVYNPDDNVWDVYTEDTSYMLVAYKLTGRKGKRGKRN